MDLKKFIKEKKEVLTTWTSFKGIFDIELEYTDRPEMDRMIDRSKERRWVKHQEVEILSDDRFNKELAGRIRGWQGLTLGKLAGLINIDIAGEDPEKDVPYARENAIALVDEAYGLNTFIQETISDLQLFREKKLVGEIKNLPTSQGSGSA